MSRPLLIGGGLLALYYLLGSERGEGVGFRYDVGGAAKGLLASQAAIGFHPCGLGWAIQRIEGGKYTVRMWSLEGNGWIPSGQGIQPLRESPDGIVMVDGVGYLPPGHPGYSDGLPVFEFSRIASAGDSISQSAGALLRANGGTVEDVAACIEAPAVARKGKISTSGVTTLQNWLQAGGEDLQA